MPDLAHLRATAADDPLATLPDAVGAAIVRGLPSLGEMFGFHAQRLAVDGPALGADLAAATGLDAAAVARHLVLAVDCAAAFAAAFPARVPATHSTP